VEQARAALFREPAVSFILLVPALFTLVYAACATAMRLWFECQGPYNVDTVLYWTVGKGILHGLVPWRDLYETKPAGIFLLSALSFLLTGGGKLTNATQVLSLLAIALSPIPYAYRLALAPGSRARAVPPFVALWALVLVLTCFVASYADSVQTEAHAMPGMVAYMLLIGVRGRRAFVGRALGILVAVGMKEPFLLAVPAVYLVLDPVARRPWADFFGPLALAGVGGAVVLLVLGYLPAYVGIYLPAMAGGHVNFHGSPWERIADATNRTWGTLAEHSVLLPTTMLFVAGVYLFQPEPGIGGPRAKMVALRFQALFLATLLAGYAVGLGGNYYGHHFVFATPFHLAILYALMAALSRDPDAGHWVRSGVIALALLTAYVPRWVGTDVLEARLADFRRENARAQRSARVIDDLLDRLHVGRYLWLGHPGGGAPLPFTRHLPLGPLFFQQTYFFQGPFRWLQSEFWKRMHEAQVVVLSVYNTGPADPKVKRVLATEYDELPASFLPDPAFPYKIFVRRGTKLP
jgi:hypothetical protein